MFKGVRWGVLALSCARMVVAQSTLYTLTTSVTNPAPIPGQPFTITWTGGEVNEAVYIVLNNYFPPLPDQDIIYGGMDILSNAPNNGSWTWNVPLNVEAGRHSFSIGYNPLMLSDTSGIFTILSSQTSYVAPTPTSAAAWTYNSCGLPPLNDYTYTGYQPPCTSTVSGKVETLYPIVPASDSSSFYPNLFTPTPAGQTTMTFQSTSIDTAFAPGILAQALQCPTQVAPSATSITVSSVTTVFYLVGCNPTTAATLNANSGVCHTSGYTTFSVSGTSSVCCPSGWATTPLDSELYCFTAVGQAEKRQASTETLGTGSSAVVEVQGLVFTSAGVVTQDAAATTGTGSSSTGTGTGTAASSSTTKSGVVRLGLSNWWLYGAVVTGAVCYL